MGIINRTKDLSEQQRKISIYATTTTNLATFYSGQIVERPCTIVSGQATAYGVSGSPQLLLGVLRFSSSTSFLIGTTYAVATYGTSGYLAYSLPAAGATTLNLQKGDVINMQTLGGTGAAAAGVIVELVVQDIQDIRTWY